MDTNGGTDSDVRDRIGKARAAFIVCNKIWKSRKCSIPTKLRIFNSNVKAVSMYGSETWRTKSMPQKIQAFVNGFL